jgi:tetratricopeptide (TPR) repeat protein
MKLLIQILFAGLVVSCALQAGVEQSASEALPDPAVSLWIMGGKGDEIVQGWPAIVTVDSLPANVGAVKLATARVRGPDLSWPWQQVSTASSGESHSRTWVLSAGDTASLPLGDAIVRISSDPLPVPVNSVLRVHVLAAPEALSPDQQADRAQGEIEYARITGDVAGSLGAAERWVLAAPGNPDALLAKARVLLALKRPEEALQAADRALAMVDKLGGKAEPPFTILRVRQEAMDAYLTVHPPPRADPASADTTQYYRFLFQGDMAEGQGDHGAARASYLQAQQWLAEKKLPLDPTEVARRLEKVEAVPAGQASRHTASNSQLVPEVASSGSKRPLAANPPANPDDAIFAQDPHGQWASTAEASSAYGSDRYSARQSTGAPNVMHYGDFAEAWASKTPQFVAQHAEGVDGGGFAAQHERAERDGLEAAPSKRARLSSAGVKSPSGPTSQSTFFGARPWRGVKGGEHALQRLRAGLEAGDELQVVAAACFHEGRRLLHGQRSPAGTDCRTAWRPRARRSAIFRFSCRSGRLVEMDLRALALERARCARRRARWPCARWRP